MTQLIALDGDGVLFDYHTSYAKAWGKVFGKIPPVKNPNAYWAMDRYHVKRLDIDEMTVFARAFDKEFWSNIPALPGAVEACLELKDAGYELVCITAMPVEHQEARQQNLINCGFPITKVYPTGLDDGSGNPKAVIVNELLPVVFVDDCLPYFKHVNDIVHKAVILRETDGSPNIGPDMLSIDTTHKNLAAFTKYWLNREFSQ